MGSIILIIALIAIIINIILSLKFNETVAKVVFVVIILCINLILIPLTFLMGTFAADSPNTSFFQHVLVILIFLGLPNFLITIIISFILLKREKATNADE